MTSLRKLDISEHPEFFMTPEKKEALEFAALQGIQPETKKKVEFTQSLITIHDILAVLQSVEELTCDDDLEEHILNEREAQGFLPNLKVLNGVPITVKVPEERASEKEAIALLKKLQFLANVYAVQQGATSQAVWFI